MFRLVIMGGPADLFKNAWFTLTTQVLETVLDAWWYRREQITVFEY